MSEEKSDEWEMSKENIRPIQQGRKQKVLNVALSSHVEDITVQQQSYENKLRTYSGDDPLSVWCNYIKWVEQNFPKGGREGHIKKLIERCLSILKNEKKYFDDERFIDIMIKYACMSDKPIDIYEYMFCNAIGCKSTKFYINWSWEVEQYVNLKKADEILNEGMKCRAEPFDKLRSYYTDFQIRLANKIKEKSEVCEIENSRSAFTMLKPQKKNLAPVSRTGETVIENKNIPLVLGKQPQPKSISSSVKVPFKIHSSENINPSLPIQSQFASTSNLNFENYKENELKPGKWNKVKVGSRDLNLKPTPYSDRPVFKFHCDEENELNMLTPQSIPKMSKILSNHSKTPSPALALFEPPDPLKRPMYPKEKVYGGAEEFSLEEIRAAKWFERRKEEEKEILLLELQTKVEYLTKQVELLQSHGLKVPVVLPQVPKPVNSADYHSDARNLECIETKNTENEIFKAKKIENLKDNNCSNLYTDSDSQSVFDLINPLSSKYKSSSDSCLPDSFENKNVSCSKMPPHSINEVEPHHLNEELIKESSSVAPTVLLDSNKIDQCELQNSILKEADTNLPFSFFYDPTGIIPSSNEIVSEDGYQQKEIPTEVSSEDDNENIPPKGYVQNVVKRELAGILEPSKNILFIPLEEQENSDSNSDHEEDYVYHNEKQFSDETFIPPSNTEQFSAAMFLSSTPFIPRCKSPNFENSKPDFASSNEKDLPINHPITDCSLSTEKEFKSDQEEIRSELKFGGDQSCLPTLPKLLSTIMEASTETYKSSSSSSSNLTRSNNLDQISSHRTSMFKPYSKLETEPSAFSSISEIQNGVPGLDCQVASELPHKEFVEDSEKIQLYTSDTDPFDQNLNCKFLNSINVGNYKNLYYINKSLRSIKCGEIVTIGYKSYQTVSLVAEGAYAKVYDAVEKSINSSEKNQKFALKVCKHSNEWEFYICKELNERLKRKKLFDLKNSVMSVILAGKFTNGIILVSDLSKLGTLLDVVNFWKNQNSAMPECLVMYFTLEILRIVSKLHACNIIHGDIKPDNFLLNSNIDKLSRISLQLIDFGRAIDLSFYKKGVCFTSILSTAHFKCNEMKDKKPWVFQLDWYGVASCIHTMLFSDYMAVRKNNNVWEIEKKLKRYWCTSLWSALFNDLLNIPECYQESNIESHISKIEYQLEQNSVNFATQCDRFLKLYVPKR